MPPPSDSVALYQGDPTGTVPARISQALTGLASTVAAASGWRGAMLTFMLGVLAATALPPIHFLPGLLAFTALAWRLETQTGAMRAALTGWLFGFGYHVAGLYWISNALLVESDRFAWLIPFAIAGLPALLALFPALTMAAIPRVSAPGWTRPLMVAVLWSVSDYARGNLLTGFPWNLPAYALSFSDSLSQAASVLGAPGLSLAVLLASVGPAIWFGSVPRTGKIPSRVGIACLAIVLLLWAGGTLRLWYAEPGSEKTTVVRVVQGNIPQKDKWKPALRAKHITRYMTLSQQADPTVAGDDLPAGTPPTVIIWPETAVPALLASDRDLRETIATVAPPGGALITGAPSSTNTLPRRLYNSMLALRPDGTIAERYDKAHLVPFGEYVPFRSWISLPSVAQSFTDFSPGPGRETIAIPGLGVASPLICYEVIFPGEVVGDVAGMRANVLLNLTNDAWYGRSSGPYQHLAIAKMRAVEEGIPLIRAANTGVSGIYDGYGQTVVQLGLDTTGVIDAYMPRPVLSRTFYSRFGDMFYVVIIFILLIGLVGHRVFAARR